MRLRRIISFCFREKKSFNSKYVIMLSYLTMSYSASVSSLKVGTMILISGDSSKH